MLENRSALGCDYARALLASVLLGIETEIGKARRLLMVINAEKAAFVPEHKNSGPVQQLEHFAFETLPSALYGETRFRLRLMGGRRCIRPAARAISK
jgi:hypothetical protein